LSNYLKFRNSEFIWRAFLILNYDLKLNEDHASKSFIQMLETTLKG
jgi:hypothetical protein